MSQLPGKLASFLCGQTSGSTQFCRISFYHPLSYVVVIQALPSASPVSCIISGSVLVLVFTFILSSAAFHFLGKSGCFFPVSLC